MNEPRFDIIDLPSGGEFYANKCSKVKVFHLCLADEEIMTAPNLINSGEMIDRLLERKIAAADDNTPFIHPSQMIVGDRLALIIFLRVTMDSNYIISVDGEPYNFDLTTLKVKEMQYKPNEKGEFDFMLPKSKQMVTFRLMTGQDEQEIRFNKNRSNDQMAFNKAVRLERIISSFDGVTSKGEIAAMVKQMNIMDANALIRFLGEVTPSLDLTINVVSPVTGKSKQQYLELTSEFFFPSI